ncbi:glycosyl hydrolase [Nonomuraea sp. NPDC005983]|uniref:glycosyl hydrolase n=1 Tax=Nonomuraea sp. NPDC005983 TaxID=3155595 RepID=UPI0033A98073
MRSRLLLLFAIFASLFVATPARATDLVIDQTAAPASAVAVFGKTLEKSGIAAVDASPGSDDPAVNVKTYGGRDCWEIGPGRPSQYIYLTLDPAFKKPYAAVDIDYFDGPSGKFALVYDAGGSDIWRETNSVPLTGSNTWKTAHFFITDGAFAGGQYGRDMRIATWANGMGGSPAPICAARLAFTPSPFATEDTQVKVTTTGNLFKPGTRATFGVLSAKDDTVPWTVRGYDGARVADGEVTVDAATREGAIDAGTLPAGYYTIAVGRRTTGFAVAGDVEADAGSMFGVNHHPRLAAGVAWDDTASLAARAGIGNVRVDLVYWNTVERPKGEYHFNETHDRYIADLNTRGQRPLLFLGLGNGDYGGIPSRSEHYEAFRKYAEAVAEHVKGKVSALELWNEYYGGFSSGVCSQSAKCYAKLLEAAWNGVRVADPDVPVIGGSSFKVPLDWWEELFQLGGLKHMNAVAVHPYRAPGAPEGLGLDLDGLKALMRKYNDGKEIPIWVTEQGWSSATAKGVGVSENTQAESVARALIEAKANGVAKYFLYDLVNDGTSSDNSEHNFGLLRAPDPAATGLTVKPSYLAYATAARELAGAYRDALDTGDPALHAARFDASTALWTSDRTARQVKLRADGPVTVADMLGAEHTLTPVGGWIHLTLTGAPLYVRADVRKVHPDPLVRLSAPARVAAGTTIPVEVTADGGAKVSFDGGTLAEVPGTRTLTGKITIRGVVAGLATVQVEVVPAPVEVNVRPGDGTLRIEVANRSGRPATVSAVDWTFGDARGTVDADAPLDPLTSKTFEADVPGQTPFAVKPVTVTARLGDGTTAQDADAFGISPIKRATPRLRGGRLEGLDDVPVVDLATVGTYNKINADVADGDLWATWDRRNLYVSAVVHEPTHKVAARNEWLPAGDSIGIGLQPGQPGEGLGRWGAEWYMLYAGEQGVFVESLPREYGVGPMPGAKVEVARDEAAKTTTYLIAIPWDKVRPLSPDRPDFSLTLTVNKNDGQPRDNYRSLGLAGWQSWGDGLNNWKLVQYQQVRLVR